MFGFNFWYKWILSASFLMIIFGLVLILFNQTSFFNYLFNNQVNAVFWGDIPLPSATMMFQQWVYSVLGAIIAGWGVFMTFISTHAFRNKERWSWNCFVFGLAVWFVSDSSVSYFFHVNINVVINILLLILFGLPLLFTKKYF